MRKQTFPFVCLLLQVLLCPCLGSARTPAGYVIRPIFSPSHDLQSLQITLSFPGDADGLTTLVLPSAAASTTGLYRCLRNLTCSGGRLTIANDSTSASVEHAPGQMLRLTYEVVQDYPGDQPTMANYLRPALQSRGFQVMGYALFVLPYSRDGYGLTLEWRDFPADWVLHNSFGSRQPTQHIEAPDLRWLESVFLGGTDLHLQKILVGGQPVWLAQRGQDWLFPTDWLVESLRKTIEVQREFWADFQATYYTAVLLPLAALPISMANGAPGSAYHATGVGLGLQNSFVAFASPNVSSQELAYTFNHEMMHGWIGDKIRDGYPAQDRQMAWFDEGFTEYFAYKNMLRAGLLTVDEYVDILNRDFFEFLYHTTVPVVRNEVIAGGFWRRYDLRLQAYKRGCVFAFFLDNAMRARGGEGQDLHQAMLDLLRHYNQPGGPQTLRVDTDFFFQTLSKYAQEDAWQLYQRYIVEGQLIPAQAFVLPSYWKLETDRNGVPVLVLNKMTQGWEMALTR